TLSLFDDDPEHFPHIFHRFVMLAPLAEHVNRTDQTPAFEFAYRGADVGAGHVERGGDVLGGEWFRGEKEQSMNLRDRAVDTPTRSHFPPVEDVVALNGGQGW